MATALQKQLAAIAASSTHQLDLKAQKSAHGKSLLFESKVAGSQSFENLYLICHEGFRELCALDARFRQFAGSLDQLVLRDRSFDHCAVDRRQRFGERGMVWRDAFEDTCGLA